MFNKEKMADVLHEYLKRNHLTTTKLHAEEMVFLLCIAMQEAVCKGKQIHIPELGKIFLRLNKARRVYDPNSKGLKMMPAKYKLKAQESNQLKEKIKNIQNNYDAR